MHVLFPHCTKFLVEGERRKWGAERQEGERRKGAEGQEGERRKGAEGQEGERRKGAEGQEGEGEEGQEEHNESSLSSSSPGLAHLLPSSIKDIKYSYLIINDTLFPIRVFNCRVILLYKVTLKEREREREREGMKEDGGTQRERRVEKMEGETRRRQQLSISQHYLSGVS